jgi:glycosyltransferase involved in cell wall biosynthesis
VDDQSGDDGREIVRNFSDTRITLIEQDHRGASLTRNHGVELAKNDFIAFLDADDEWMPRYLETILRLIRKYPEAGMYTTAWKISTGEGKTQWANFQNIPAAPWEGVMPDYFRSGALGDDPVMASGAVIPREIFHEVGGFPEGYWFGEDTDLFGRIALKYPVAFSWEFGALYHVDASNRSCIRKMPLDIEEPFVKNARQALRSGEVPEELKESLQEFITKKEIYRCYLNLHEGNLQTGLAIVQQCTTKLRRYERLKLIILAKFPSRLYRVVRDIRQWFITFGLKKQDNDV